MGKHAGMEENGNPERLKPTQRPHRTRASMVRGRRASGSSNPPSAVDYPMGSPHFSRRGSLLTLVYLQSSFWRCWRSLDGWKACQSQWKTPLSIVVGICFPAMQKEYQSHAASNHFAHTSTSANYSP